MQCVALILCLICLCGIDIMSHLSINHCYEVLKKGRASIALKGEPGTSSWSVTEVNLNTIAAIVQEDATLKFQIDLSPQVTSLTKL